MKNENIDYGDVILPPTAVVIKVTNILTPYIVKICKIKDYEEKLNIINKKLLLLEKRGLFNADTKRKEPETGDMIVVCDKLQKDIDLPAWLCRGNISNGVDNLKDAYNIFLVDYGISVTLQKEDFAMCSNDLISEEYLSSTVGLYNVLPIAIEYDSSIQENTSVIVLQEWSASAIQYTKELMTASNAIYFDHLVSDEYGKQYGEFYLNIEDTIISLSETLVLNNYAVYLQEELLEFIKNPKNYEKPCKEVINGETVFHINISNYKRNKEPCKEEESVKRVNKLKEKKYLHAELRQEKEKVLIYGKIKYECLHSISDLRFPAEIHKVWKSLIQSSRPTNIQSYIWPAIKKGLDVIAIGAAKSGKSFGCGLAICGLLVTTPNLPQGVNPSALILCSSSSKVLEVHSLCAEFLQNYRTIKSVAAINGKSDRSLLAEMFNGCQILISTPKFLARFIKQSRKVLNFENLRYLILDDGDIILDKYFDSISKLFKKYKIIYNRDIENRNIILQIIVTAKHWTPHLKRIAGILMDSPYICIASFIEAVIFKSIHPKIYLMNSKNKDKKILDLLSDKYSKSRTVIVCLNNEEAEELHKFLKPYKDCLLVHENMNLVYLQGIKQCWDACVSGSYSILICTDEVLSDIGITNATWLIHYSISLRAKTQFNFRFSTLLECLQMEKSNCKVTIMADENNDIQFLSIIKILQRMNVSISQNMLEKIKQITATLDKKKESYPLCNNIKSWGFCYKKDSCTFRHRIISEIDAPIMNLQINDKIKFRVLSIHDATHVSARMISHIKIDTLEETKFSNVEYMQITMKIQEFYSFLENRRCSEAMDVGSIHGLEEPVDSFKRVQILRIDEEDKTDRPKFVDVKCIDNGVILTKVNVRGQAHRLLHMPEAFVKYPSQVIEVFLVGIAPHDDEYLWNHCATDIVYQWFKENVDERSYVIGTVKLHLRNTVWVNTLEVGTKLIGYNDLIGFSLKTELLKTNHAVENDKHLSKMYQLCKDAGFSKINGCNLNDLINKIV